MSKGNGRFFFCFVGSVSINLVKERPGLCVVKIAGGKLFLRKVCNPFMYYCFFFFFFFLFFFVFESVEK